MPLPKDLVSRAKQRLERPAPPSVQDLINGDKISEVSPEYLAGERAIAQLAADDIERHEAALDARRAQEKARQEHDDAVWARIQRRRRRA